MTIVLRPRIWIFEQGVLYFGPVPGNQVHAHRALQVLISRHGRITADQGHGTESISAKAMIIGPLVRHRIHIRIKAVYSLFYEPSAFTKVTAHGQPFKECVLSREDKLFLDEWNGSDLSGDEAQKIFSFGARLAGLTLRHGFQAVNVDPRVEAVLTKLHSTDSPAVSIKALADEVELSPSRLIHLFSENLQMPLRSYYLWLKLRRSLDALARGENLTSAAYVAGFSDSAHYSRIFARTFGFPPSVLRLAKISKV
jgi:AraC-like DNA-binding protein